MMYLNITAVYSSAEIRRDTERICAHFYISRYCIFFMLNYVQNILNVLPSYFHERYFLF